MQARGGVSRPLRLPRLASRRESAGEIAGRIDAAVKAGHLPAQDTQLAVTALLDALHEALVGLLAPARPRDAAVGAGGAFWRKPQPSIV